MESSPSRSSLAPIAGTKRPASLLPAFEPLTSSPSLPRPQKRVAREPAVSMYPTPVPTSSTHIMSSSPPAARQTARRIFSAASERAPLSTVPELMLPDNGEPLLMGRSSASCQHQLANSRMISRVHVKATYKPAPNPFDRDRVEIMCMGWNGIKIHCQGKKYDLAKGKTFTSDIKDADIMIDVHESRVLVQWPRNDNEHDRKDCPSTDSEQTCDEATPTQRRPLRALQDSPFPENQRLASPVSPSPAVQRTIPPSSPLFSPSRTRAPVVVYEDQGSPLKRHNTVAGITSPSARRASVLLQRFQGSDLGRHEEDSEGENDEENDPIIHSFGPFGENLLPRMASFHAGDSPIRSARSPSSLLPAQPLQPALSPNQPFHYHKRDKSDEYVKPSMDEESITRIRNHAANQLAFSRLASTPFSTILNNFPPDIRKSVGAPTGPSRLEIRSILENTDIIGQVSRQGKDAAGKPLEAEYYYVPDFDHDPTRLEAHKMGKPGLRNCRKQHKQYFWRKPK
ncbi:hypothetical protein N7481_011607 [Penicillium waksmanii]|uniref:uncharacterized protein n=1 Tax=Penicillium waksmanii TaxID=69791 RepID=UPI002549A62E|nr:uncharacterized protein N7481_011607 [Penicillium waksmanii]KAJ5974397.1 hypothetical protein N7481_011607 [Penicillium waksmanii]